MAERIVPRRLWIALAALFGIAFGVGIFTFGYAEGYSYLLNDPSACANCHIMDAHYTAWRHGPHRSVATCNDCHTPPGLVPKYMTKASNGFWHSFAFTTGRFPDPIRIKEHNRLIAEKACWKCHAAITDMIDPLHDPAAPESLSCLRCHDETGHIE